MRHVLLEESLPGVQFSRRATDRMAALREEYAATVHPDGLVVAPWDSGQVRWWTWAGARANGALAAALVAVSP